MSELEGHLQEYLALRRALGFKLVGEGRLLAGFVAFALGAGEQTITTQTALRWARLPHGASPSYLSRGLRAVRGVRALPARARPCLRDPANRDPAPGQEPRRPVRL